MKTSLVLTLIGPDRPGLVQAISQAVSDHGGNWEHSRMARLAGQFAGILEIGGLSDRAAQELRTSLANLTSAGLQVVVQESQPQPGDAPPRQRFQLEVVGNDREGIVRDLAAALATREVNVEELSTECEAAAMSGTPLFRAHAELTAPGQVAIDELRAALEGIGDDLMVDVNLVAVSSGKD